MHSWLKNLPPKPVIGLLALVLFTAATLMIGAARQDSATVDETTYLGAGYSFFKTGSYRLTEGHPILSQIIASFPIKFFNVHESPTANALLEGRAGLPYSLRWTGPVGDSRILFPNGPDFYQWALPETQLFGQLLVCDPANDADGMLFWGRIPEIVFTLLTALVVFAWARQLAGDWAGVLAAALWALNPVTLAYGHLILTDPSVTLMIVITSWGFCRFLREPTRVNALWVGVGFGLGLVMKFTATSLVPMCGVATFVYWFYRRHAPGKSPASWLRQLAIGVLLIGLSAWGVLLVVYFPHWSPAPFISPERAEVLGVPGWYQAFRPILIPKDFFKGITLLICHVRGGADSYLLGQWSQEGWWYYYPLAIFWKSPLPWLALLLIGLGLLMRSARAISFERLLPWLAAGTYLGFAMTGHINIGIRHVLPVFPLVAVGIADQIMHAGKRWQIGAWVLSGWLAVVSLGAYPLFIAYFNELAGGPESGWRYLVDSNFDWGQDAKRLRAFLDEHGIQHIYLDYFGTQYNIDYLKIPNTRVNADQARNIKDGWLVVSASELMHPEWAWLRESREPTARVAYTLFVYRISGQTSPAQRSP